MLLATVLMISLWGLCLWAGVWLGVLRPVRQANAALAELNASLGLAPVATRESLWRATREQFTWT